MIYKKKKTQIKPINDSSMTQIFKSQEVDDIANDEKFAAYVSN